MYTLDVDESLGCFCQLSRKQNRLGDAPSLRRPAGGARAAVARAAARVPRRPRQRSAEAAAGAARLRERETEIRNRSTRNGERGMGKSCPIFGGFA